MICIAAIVLLGLLLWARWVYARANRGAWAQMVLGYLALRVASRDEAGPETAEEAAQITADFIRLCEVWPTHWVMAYVWVWDYRRFIVNQDEMQTVLDFLAKSGTVGTD